MEDLYFTHIKINSIHRNLIVCKSWYKNIICHLNIKKVEFYDMQLYNAINNKYIFLLYSSVDNVLLRAYDNIIINTMKIIVSDNVIRDKIMEKLIDNYKQLSIIISSLFNNYNIYKNKDIINIDKYMADEYANILSKYYDYNIILT